MIAITEGIPVRDMAEVNARLATSNTRLIGPNCPGIITPANVRSELCPVTFTSRERLGLFPVRELLPMKRFGKSLRLVMGSQPVLVSVEIRLMELAI